MVRGFKVADLFQFAGIVIRVFCFLVFGINFLNQIAGCVILIGGFLTLRPDFFDQPVVAIVFKPGDVVLGICQGHEIVTIVIGVMGFF